LHDINCDLLIDNVAYGNGPLRVTTVSLLLKFPMVYNRSVHCGYYDTILQKSLTWT